MKKAIKSILLIIILVPILFFIFSILFLFGLNYVIKSLSPYEEVSSTHIFNVQIGNIYSDNNIYKINFEI